MFGYVAPLVPELKVKEHNFYKSVYCGLCRCMKKSVCASSSFTLSYDMVFLALVLMQLAPTELKFSKKRCGVHPLKKAPVLEANPPLEYCARAGALLSYYKLADDISDKKGMGRLFRLMLMPEAKRMRKKAALPELDGIIKDRLKKLGELEKENCGSIDRVSDLFGELLGEVFAGYFPAGDRRGRLIAYEAGFHCGRWIYILDAADDFDADKTSGAYNPLRAEGAESVDEVRETLGIALGMELKHISDALSLAPGGDEGIKAITDNIISLGMPSKEKAVLFKRDGGK